MRSIILGLCGALGLIVITASILVFPSSQRSMLGPPLVTATIAAWPGIPFLVSFLANGENGNIKQAVLAGSIATLLGMVICILIAGVLLNPLAWEVFLFFFPCVATGAIVFGGVGTVAGLARNLSAVRIGLWGGLCVIALVTLYTLLALSPIPNYFVSIPLITSGLVWLGMPFLSSLFLTSQMKSVGQAILASSFASLFSAVGTVSCTLILMLAFPRLFEGGGPRETWTILIGILIFSVLFGFLGIVTGLIGSFLGWIIWIR